MCDEYMWVGILCLVFIEKSRKLVKLSLFYLGQKFWMESWDEESEKGGGVGEDVSLPL